MRLTEGELVAWGQRIGRELGAGVDTETDGRSGVGAVAGTFIGLRGPLGAGKSVLARAVARGAGVEEPMPSPTFNLVFSYPLPGGGSVVHADLYRIQSAGELAMVGWDDLLAESSIALVEWPERASDELPPDRWEIELAADPEEGVRTAVARRYGTPPELPA